MMNICKFCKKNEADKKNTHYLTDSIIRSCLNIDGSNDRTKGFYYEIDTEKPFVEYNFQRDASSKIEELIGRNPTEEEIEKSKNETPFSVDFIFCTDCEVNRFGDIETKFTQGILPKFRNSNLTDLSDISIKESLICRNFFYLQIFRSAICEEEFDLPDDFVNKLRKILYEKIENYSIPLSITYLQTTGEKKAYTENTVGYRTVDKNPYIIFFNDFIIQFYDTKENIKHLEFYGLNEDDYKRYININEKEFIFNIFQNNKRKEFQKNVLNEKVNHTMTHLLELFDQCWIYSFKIALPLHEKEKFLQAFKNYTKENIMGQR